MSGSAAEAVLKRLRAEADPQVRREMGERYGIRTEQAFGVPMRLMKSIAEPLAPDHLLADRLWTSGWYEARTIAVLIDDPDQVTVAQMRRWCDDFDNWAIVDSACFNLFDRTPDAWAMVPEWAADDREFVRRAGFAQLWALALHDRDALMKRSASGCG